MRRLLVDHGYATEAARAAVEWAWHSLEVDRLISVIDPANAASLAVAGRLGMRHLRDDEHHGHAVVIMAVESPGSPTGV